jgi:protein-S-isoprenylcysteine O-methyltransferase Ste14
LRTLRASQPSRSSLTLGRKTEMKLRQAPRWLAIVGAVISIIMFVAFTVVAFLYPMDHVELNPQFRIINSAFYTGLIMGSVMAWLASVAWLCLKSAIKNHEK